MTGADHIERELALFKLHLVDGRTEELKSAIDDFNARVLADHEGHYTIELIGGSQEIDRFLDVIADLAELSTVVRSGAMAIARGAPMLSQR
jgi:acetolactate synthase small subunit